MKFNDTTSPEKKPGHIALDTSNVQLVKDFYQGNDISCQAPGKHHCGEIKREETDKSVIWNVNEAYALFREEHPVELVGKSSLRPPQCQDTFVLVNTTKT